MKGIAAETIFMIIIGIILVLGFIWAMMSRFTLISDFVERTFGTVRRTTASIVGGGGCAELPLACRQWVYEGLGLFFTYKEANVYPASNECGILSSVCPSEAGSRIGVKDCLSMCAELVRCESDYADLGFGSVSDCYENVKGDYK